MRLRCLSILLYLGITGFSQRTIEGDGSDYRESRTVPSFNKIGLSCQAEVILVKGNSPGVRIEGEKNIVDKLITEVGDNELKIYFPLFRNFRSTKPLRVWVTTSDIQGIWNSGSGSIHSADVFSGESVSFHLSGSGRIELGVKAEQMSVSVSGSGSVNLTTDGVIEGRISGSGNINYKGNPSSVDVHHSGSGRARKVA